MRTKGNRKTHVNIVTLGCSKNLVDSENILTQLKGNSISASHEATDNKASIVVINTCGFIDNAKQESIDTILRYVDAKENGLVDKVYVTGCLSHRYKNELEVEIPAVDAFFGTNELPRLLKTLNADYKKELLGERLTTTPRHYSYLKISEGCNRPCSFCAIPIMRGRLSSRPIEDLITESRNLVKSGTKEIILIAQDLTDYGIDIYKKRVLADLLRNLSDIPDLKWIRMQYAFPSQFPEDILPVMKERENICKYLDMPLQHVSTNVLKVMRRGITGERTKQLIKSIREEVPGISLRTTLIAGHPGETEDDFRELCQFVEESRFERLGIFTYSHEENTHAYSLPDVISQEIKQSRANEIMDIQEKISYELNSQKIGNTYNVLIDKKESGYYVGRTEFDSPEVDNEVLIPTTGEGILVNGEFYNVEINDATEFDLYGSVVNHTNQFVNQSVMTDHQI